MRNDHIAAIRAPDHLPRVRIGTAGWSIPAIMADHFPAEGSGLERYASGFNGCEINSTFYRSHRISTWHRWRDVTPSEFRFSVKMPKLVTHRLKLSSCDAALDDFLGQAGALGDKLGVLLVQLPPSLVFDATTAAGFFSALSARTPVAAVCEPRHASWFGPEADELLKSYNVARVAADPSLSDVAARPGGSRRVEYWRLHGSPAMYRSSYAERLEIYAKRIRQGTPDGEKWCIFDNTASSAATLDALKMRDLLARAAANRRLDTQQPE